MSEGVSNYEVYWCISNLIQKEECLVECRVLSEPIEFAGARYAHRIIAVSCHSSFQVLFVMIALGQQKTLYWGLWLIHQWSMSSICTVTECADQNCLE
jgi:hypothetical protein